MGWGMSERVKVGVVGCGLIAQVMHLNYLRELSDRYEIAAIADLSPEVRDAVGAQYGVARRFAKWEDLIAEPLDAVIVLTSGSHAPIAIAAAERGMHVLVEKPMCFSVAEGQAMIEASRNSKKTLMVAYNKRYDPAYLRFVEEAKRMRDTRLLRVTTLESPIAPYIQQYPLFRGGPLPADVVRELKDDDERRLAGALGDADELSRWGYRYVLLDTLVHEFSAMRGALGEPDRLDFADIRKTGFTAVLTFGDIQCVFAWVDLPVIARYEMEFALYSPTRRVTLSFPSPFLRSMPTLLITEEGEETTPRASRTEEVTSYQESFKEELVHFHECVTTGREPRTSGVEALHDIALCEAVVKGHRTRQAVARPSDTDR